MNKKSSVVMVIFFSLLLFSLSAMCYFSPDKEYTDSERRLLATFPVLNSETLVNGEFIGEFEKYSADQFPFRDTFRTVKATFLKYVLNKKENNGLFVSDGHISKLDGELNENMLDYAVKLFRNIYEKNIKDKNSKVYLSVVPDKNNYIGNGYPTVDYAEIENFMKEKTSDYMTFIPIAEALSADDYYKTDSHWKQENLGGVVQILSEKMGVDTNATYSVKTLNNPFYGVYAGQSALSVKPDKIKYLTNDVLENSIVTYYDTGKPEKGELYDMKKAYGKDPYEMFLSGAKPLVTIENPKADTKKELIMFRDSFGSSLAPLLIEGYKKITIVDIRYVQSAFLSNFIDFDNSDILFIYSTAILNNSLSMK